MIELTFDDVVWERIFTQLKCLYDKDNIEMPKRKVTYRDEMRGTLKKYLDENSQLIAEVPSFLSDDKDVDMSRISGAYSLPITLISKGCNINSLCARLRLLTYRELVEEAYQLEHKKSNINLSIFIE